MNDSVAVIEETTVAATVRDVSLSPPGEVAGTGGSGSKIPG